MKKGFRLFTLLISSALFLAGCTKDAPGRWQELPSGPTDVSKTAVTYNGGATTGTVAFNASGSETGVVTLTNVVGNYPEVKVDVQMTEGESGTFSFKGTKEVTTTKANFATAIITVSGTVKTDGKIDIKVSTKGTGTIIGTYKGATLVINYGDARLYGREIVATAVQNGLSINFEELIPGIKAQFCVLESQDNGVFSIEADFMKITAKRQGATLILDITATPADPLSLVKNYSLAPYKVRVESITDEFDGTITQVNRVTQGGGWVTIAGGPTSSSYAPVFRGLAGIMLAQVMQSVSLNSDGTITSKIQAKPAIKFDPMWVFAAPGEAAVNAMIPTSGWSDSPKGLAFWYQKDGKLYLKLDVANILAGQMGVEQGEGFYALLKPILAGENEAIRKMIASMLKIDKFEISDDTFNMLKGWIMNGIPLNVKKEGGRVQFFLDKAAMNSLMSIRTVGGKKQSEVSYLFGILSTAGLIPQDAALAVGFVNGISGEWDKITDFELGLDLIAQ